MLPRARASKRKGRAEAASLDPARPWHFRVERSCNESQVTKQSRSGRMETEELTFFGERFVKSYFIGTKGEKGFVLLCKKMVGISLSSVWPTSGGGMVNVDTLLQKDTWGSILFADFDLRVNREALTCESIVNNGRFNFHVFAFWEKKCKKFSIIGQKDGYSVVFENGRNGNNVVK